MDSDKPGEEQEGGVAQPHPLPDHLSKKKVVINSKTIIVEEALEDHDSVPGDSTHIPLHNPTPSQPGSSLLDMAMQDLSRKVSFSDRVIESKQNGMESAPTSDGSDDEHFSNTDKVPDKEVVAVVAVVEEEGHKEDVGVTELTEQPVDTEVEDRAVSYSPDSQKRFHKYDIEIGRGSFKTVYKGLDAETGVAIAWCELQENRYNKSEQLRFKDEVNILKTLQHPNILRLYDTWEVTLRGDKKDRKVLVLVTELMTSGTLKGYMRRLKAVKPKVIRSWGRQILRGLYFLHTRTPPIIHRDLKCDNIFINGTTGLVKIGDLGLATLKRSDVKTVIGTPEFMAPEMYEESYDESVDVYAFGMCLLEMCTQEYPYMECSNPAQIYKRVTQGIKPNAVDKVKNLVLLNIIEKCTIVSKTSRYTVKMLLNHEFFAEGVKIETFPKQDGENEDYPVLHLRMEIPTKETSKKNNQESIEFSYDIDKDHPEVVVGKMVKFNTLRGDEQVQKNVIRSLREYVDIVKQKKRHVHSKEDSKGVSLSSGSEITLGEGELSGLPRLSHQLSNAEVYQPLSDIMSESSDKGDITTTPSSSAGNGFHTTTTTTIITSSKTPAEKGGVSKTEDVKQWGEVTTPTPSNRSTPTPHATSNRTYSESVVNPAADVPSKSQTAPPTGTVAPPTGAGDGEDKRDSVSSKFKFQKKVTHIQEGSQLVGVSEESSTYLMTHVSDVITTGHSLEASSSSSLSDHPPVTTTEKSQGNGKKKATRGKQRQLKLEFQELTSDNVVKCTLNTNTGQVVEFRFSMKYDKPVTIFRELVKAGHLTSHDEEEFLRQTKKLLEAIHKKKDSSGSISSKLPPVTDAKSQVTELYVKSRLSEAPSLEPALVSLNEAKTIYTTTDDHGESSTSSRPSVGVKQEDSTPSGMSIEEHSTTSSQQDPSNMVFSALPNTGVQCEPHSMVTYHPLPSNNEKRFEVALVEEADSPPPSGTAGSDISAQSSTENVCKDTCDQYPQSTGHTSDQYPHPTGHTSDQYPHPHTYDQYPHPTGHTYDQYPHPTGHTSDQYPHPTGHTADQYPHPHTYDQYPHPTGHTADVKRTSIQPISWGPKRASDTTISVSDGHSYISSDTENMDMAQYAGVTHAHYQLQPQNYPVSHSPRYSSGATPVVSYSTTAPTTHNHHYSTTSCMPHSDQKRRILTPDVYVPLHYHSLSHIPHEALPSQAPPSQAPPATIPSLSDVPHGDLLTKAFMTFLYSIGSVFRDPSFAPLLDSLDTHFGSHHRPKQRHVSREENVEPTPVIPSEEEEEEMGSEEEVMKKMQKLDMEMKKLERKKKKLLMYASSKKGDSGSSLDSSGHLSSKKFSDASVEMTAFSPLPNKQVTIQDTADGPSHPPGHHTHISPDDVITDKRELDFSSNHHIQGDEGVGHSWLKHSDSCSPLQSGGDTELSSPSHEKWSEASFPSDVKTESHTFPPYPPSPTASPTEEMSGVDSVSRENSSEWADHPCSLAGEVRGHAGDGLVPGSDNPSSLVPDSGVDPSSLVPDSGVNPVNNSAAGNTDYVGV